MSAGTGSHPQGTNPYSRVVEALPARPGRVGLRHVLSSDSEVFSLTGDLDVRRYLQARLESAVVFSSRRGLT